MRELAISYLRHYKSDFGAVKSKVGLLDEYIPSMQTRAPENFCVRLWGAERSKEQTKPNNSAETGAEAEYSASYKGSRTVINNYSASVKPKPN